MKAALLAFLVIAPSILADSSDEPGNHFFTVPSPTNKFYAVHTVRRWEGTKNISSLGRIQIFDAETGREVWRLDGILVSEGNVFPADDGIHLVILRSWLRGVGTEVKRNEPVISFYDRGRLLKAQTLDDLQIDPKKLTHSVSHSEFYRSQSALGAWHWDWPLGSEWANVEISTLDPNPYWRDGAFELTTLDQQKFRFDPATGNRILEKSKQPK